MKRTTEKQFMNTIKQALGRKVGETRDPIAPEIPDDIVRLVQETDDMVAIFQEKAEYVGLEVTRIPSRELETTLKNCFCELEAKTAVLAMNDRASNISIHNAIKDAGIEELSSAQDRNMQQGFIADVGITDVHAAFAETGTLVCNSDSQHARAASIAVPTHIAIVRASDLLPDMIDYMRLQRKLSPSELPAAQAFITGPSKTADIEGILVTGVHGPGRVLVLLIEDA